MSSTSAGPHAGRRGPLRLVVPSPDGRRILARPNGLAGWALPQVAVDLPFAGWDDATTDAASRLLGADVEPDAPVVDGAWAVKVDRVGAAGNTWIGEDETDRLGTDAGIARAWFAQRDGPEG